MPIWFILLYHRCLYNSSIIYCVGRFDMDYCKIGQNIREIRRAKGLSQELLAEKVNISVTHMSHIETGNTKLSLKVFVDIADALEVNSDELLGRKADVFCSCGEEIAVLFSDCDIRKMKILADILKAAKVTLDENI